MNVNISLVPILSLAEGILVLTLPQKQNYVIAVYLIAIGLIGLFGLR